MVRADLPTVVIVDDSPEVRALVRAQIRLSDRLDVVGEGSNGLDAAALANRLHPDLMLLDAGHSSLLPSGDVVESLISSGTSAAIHTVICDGRILMRSGRLVQASARHAIESANERRDDLLRRARAAGTWHEH